MRKIKIEAATREKVERAIETGVAFAEEQARKRFVAKVDPVPLAGDTKREIAKHKARSLAPEGLALLSDSELEDLVDAKVNRLRPSLSAPPMSAATPSGAPGPARASSVPLGVFPPPPKLPGGA